MKVIEPPSVSKTWKISLDPDKYYIDDGTSSVSIFYVEVTESVVSGIAGSEQLTMLFYLADTLAQPIRRSVPALFGEPMVGVPKELVDDLRVQCTKSLFSFRDRNPWNVLDSAA